MTIYTFLFLVLQALLLEVSTTGPDGSQKLNEMTTYIYTRTYRSLPEVAEDPYDPCHSNPCDQFCINENGRFRCLCRRGYRLDVDGKRCRVISEALFPSIPLNCRINNGGCEQICRMRMNSRHCFCFPGYKLLADGEHCASNIQASTTGPVGSQELNEMTTDIYPGTHPSLPEVTSVPYDPCHSNPCDHICYNENGRFRCLCRRGYRLDGDGKRCRVFRLRNACRVPYIQNGDYGRYISENFEKVTRADFTRNEELLTLRCHKGYAPFPRQSNDSREGFFEGEIKCEDRMWSKNLSCHSSSCSYVPRIKSDSPIVENEQQKRNHGDVITYAFWDDSTLIEKGKVKCHFGEWIGTATELMDEFITCSEFETSSGVEVSYTEGVSVGSYALFSCSSRSILEGESYAICLNNGTWSHSLPRCKESVTCNEFTSSPGLQISYSNGGSVGSRVSFSCLPPNVLKGSSYAVCLSNGTWSHSSPSCTDPVTCSEFQTSAELQVSYSKGVSVGSKATFKCSPPGTLYGKSYAVCLVNGSWSSLPRCRGSNTCPVFEILQGLEVTYTYSELSGLNASFRCTPPNILDGNSYAICQNNGSWSHPLPSCKGINGCYLKQLESSTLLIDPKKESYSLGDVINLGCPPGHELTRKVERLMCLGKQWSDILPDCKESLENL